MGIVRMLPEDLINKIAAGEVVERPASALKELVENALDAGSTRIEIDVERGGKRLLRVTDNGSGMTQEDAEMALQRHATSKIKSEEDLFRILTMGFRGEALPSIASVSRFTLTTCTPDDPVGTQIRIEGGDPDVQRAARAPGTTVEIKDLFFNVPGRRKFLKTDGTEFSHIAETVTRLALANPEIHFRLSHNGRNQLQTNPTTDLRERVSDLLGRQVGQSMHPVAATMGWLKMHGLFSEPTHTTKGTKGIYLFVNGRFIRDRGLAHACQEAYRGTIEKGRFPYVLMFLEIDPSEVDVNVHPQKIEVRFHRQHEVYSRLLTTLRNAIARAPWLQMALANHSPGPVPIHAPEGSDYSDAPMPDTATADLPLAPSPVIKSPPAPQAQEASPKPSPTVAASPSVTPSNGKASSAAAPKNFDEFRARFLRAAEKQNLVIPGHTDQPKEEESLPPLPAAQTGLPFLPGWDSRTHNGGEAPTPAAPPEATEDTETQANAEPPTKAPQRMGFFSSLRYIGQLTQMYLVLEMEGKMILIDQHAAHERISYQKLMADYERSQIPEQGYLLPPRLELSLTEAQQASQYADQLRQLGIDLEPFGGQSFVLKSVPVYLKNADPYELIRDVLEELSAGKRTATLDERRDIVLMRMACHGSVRGPNPLSHDEVRALLQQMDEIDFSAHCPHGRPVFIEYPIKELEKRFHRT
ncbi:MAG: DNA mismatch repair endonuclease MutL [Deltaproteobacteria bacterium]|nr:MAG: DNA mismatch repair endonuclease MutL [Deltaproteobacteria bacterium]